MRIKMAVIGFLIVMFHSTSLLSRDIQGDDVRCRPKGHGYSRYWLCSSEDVDVEYWVPMFGGYLNGIVKNRSSRPLESVFLEFSLYDSEGIKMGMIISIIGRLGIGKKARFQEYISGDSADIESDELDRISIFDTVSPIRD